MALLTGRGLVARLRLVPETDGDREALGVCRGSARVPIPGSATGTETGLCGGCGARVALEADGTVANHPQ